MLLTAAFGNLRSYATTCTNYVTSTRIENLSNTVSYVGLIHDHSNFIAILPTCKFVNPCM